MEPSFLNRLGEQKHLVLLLTLVSTIVVQPLAPGVPAGLIAYGVLRTLVVFTVFFVIFQRRRERLLSLVLGLPVTASTWTHYALPGRFETVLGVVYHGFLVAFLGFAVAVILHRILDQKIVRADDVIGAICGYLLVGMVWGSLYLLVEILLPGTFSVQQEITGRLIDWDSRQSLFDYYSFMTLTTVGYSDITPLRPPATSLIWIEAVFGQFYIAVIVAQLVGAKLAQTLQQAEPKS